MTAKKKTPKRTPKKTPKKEVEVKKSEVEVKKEESLFPDLRNEIEGAFTNVLESWPRFGKGWHWPEFEPFGKFDFPVLRGKHLSIPKVDFFEADDNYELTAELPGMTKDDVECTLVGNRLTVKGEKREAREEEKKGYHLKERRFGSFMRSITLPEDVDTDNIDAAVSDGVLRISMPKSEKMKSRKIDVKKS